MPAIMAYHEAGVRRRPRLTWIAAHRSPDRAPPRPGRAPPPPAAPVGHRRASRARRSPDGRQDALAVQLVRRRGGVGRQGHRRRATLRPGADGRIPKPLLPKFDRGICESSLSSLAGKELAIQDEGALIWISSTLLPRRPRRSPCATSTPATAASRSPRCAAT